jgi:hypothetical protein
MFFPKTYKLNVDIDVPIEQTVKVTFVDGDGLFYLKEWNGNDIYYYVKNKNSFNNSDKIILTVPAGDTSFTFDITFVFSSRDYVSKYPIKNIELKYTLEPGKKYQIGSIVKSNGFLKPSSLAVGIYDVTKRKTLLKEWILGSTR